MVVLDGSGTEPAHTTFADSQRPQRIRFSERVRKDRITLRVLSTHTPPFASLAEVELLP